MCSIIGYYGNNQAATVLVKGLEHMEYRGYDSVGIATFYGDRIWVRKGVGKVVEVNNTLKLDLLSGTVGIGHTRWATHGGVSEANAHPHASSSNRIAIVHNGIIDNYEVLKRNLELKGFVFKSETDSEVIANLLEDKFNRTRDIKQATMRTVAELRGSYGFVAVFPNGTLVAARFHEPLIIGVGRDGYFAASDVLGFVEYTDEVMYINDNEFLIIDALGLHVFDFDGIPARHQITKVSKEFGGAHKGKYAHFTLKEISEQPTVILKAGENSKPELELVADIIGMGKNLYTAGSGTSYHACLIAQYLLSKFARIKIEPIIASEAKFSPHHLDSQSILIALSQSGESADVLEAVSIAKNNGAKIISIVNVMTSSLVHQSSVSIGLNCGPEIGVAATKSFTSQLAVLYKIVDKLSEGRLGPDFSKISACMSKLLSDYSNIRKIAGILGGASDIYVLGRGIHYPIASEGALKLKELTYIHAEGLPGGELKHGPLALIDTNASVIIINPNDSTYVDTLASAHEIRARGAKIIGISDKPSDIYDYWIEIPTVSEALFPLIEIVPLQLLAYYTAIEKDADPDYPRNLAKCVTVK